jgi:thioredoxin reductase (NADPH)
VTDIITSVDFAHRPFRLTGDSGTVYTGDAVIIATGAEAKWLHLPSEQKFKGYGVSACATCDGFFYKNKEVIVIGGGNTAVEEALYLTNHASKVTLIHRRDELRAERILQERLFSKENVKFLWDMVVDEIVGEKPKPPMPASVTGIRVQNVKTGEKSEIDTHGVFVAIGHAPAVSLFVGKLKQKPSGYLWTAPDSTQTDVPGVFAAGDVTDETYRQAVTAAGLGCMAALEAERYLAEMELHREAAE